MDSLQLPVGARIRLVRPFYGYPTGSEGVVIGFYRKDRPAYAVSLDGASVEIPPEYVEAVDRNPTRP